MKQIVKLLSFVAISFLCVEMSAQTQKKSVVRTGVEIASFSPLHTGLSVEYAYHVTPAFSASVRLAESNSQTGERVFRNTSMVMRGYLRPWHQADYWRRLEAGVGVGYGYFFIAENVYEQGFYVLQQQSHHMLRLEVPVRIYIVNTGKWELAAEAAGVWHYKKNLTFYGYRVGVNFGVSF